MPATREVHADGWCVRLDLSRQVLGLEVPEFVFGWRPEGEQAQPLLPTPPAADDGPVSAATLLLKAKQFDDGLYAAVELAAQQGAGRFAGKASLLRSLAGTLAAGLPDAGRGRDDPRGLRAGRHRRRGPGRPPGRRPHRSPATSSATNWRRSRWASTPGRPSCRPSSARTASSSSRSTPTTADDLARALERTPGPPPPTTPASA